MGHILPFPLPWGSGSVGYFADQPADRLVIFVHGFGLDSPENLAELGLCLDDVLAVLDHHAVARYFESYYPYAPPVLLRESFRTRNLEAYLEALAAERHAEGWVSAFHQFMMLDSAFNAAGPLDMFLGVLDDYTIDDLDLADLRKAFRREERMRDLLQEKAGRRLLEGLQDFFEFSEDLDAFLAETRRFPVFAGLVWLNYGYWYGAGGERMRVVADWVVSMLEAMSSRRFDEAGPVDPQTARELQATMERLTDLKTYPLVTLKFCAEPLKRWEHSVRGQRVSGRPG